jgi:hypothetical protein
MSDPSKPSLGRVVLVHTPNGDYWTGLIVCVHSPTMVNVGGFDPNGKPLSASSVNFGTPVGTNTWCEFPPRV